MCVFENISATTCNSGLVGLFSGLHGELPEQQ